MTQAKIQRIGGSFAPPLDSSKLNEYRDLIELAPKEAAYYMGQLCGMMEAFQQESPSRKASTPHPVGIGLITELEKEQVERLWDTVPWKNECDGMSKCFEELEAGPVRNAAFHLLWYAYELTEDRQPFTSDMLPESVHRKGQEAKAALKSK